MKYDICCFYHIILFEFSAVDKLYGFGMVTNVNVGHSGSAHKKYNKICAVKQTVFL
jgi:hypothetical protein